MSTRAERAAIRQVLAAAALPEAVQSLDKRLDAVRTELLCSALKNTRGDVTRAARDVGISRTYLHRLLRAAGIKAQQYCEPGKISDATRARRRRAGLGETIRPSSGAI